MRIQNTQNYKCFYIYIYIYLKHIKATKTRRCHRCHPSISPRSHNPSQPLSASPWLEPWSAPGTPWDPWDARDAPHRVAWRSAWASSIICIRCSNSWPRKTRENTAKSNEKYHVIMFMITDDHCWSLMFMNVHWWYVCNTFCHLSICCFPSISVPLSIDHLNWRCL